MELKADIISNRFLRFAVDIIKLVSALGDKPVHRHIGMQLFRSATAIGANYEEARGAESTQDFIHKMQIVLKESRESLYWLKLISESGITKNPNLAEILDENRQICDIVAKSIKTLKSKNKAKPI